MEPSGNFHIIPAPQQHMPSGIKIRIPARVDWPRSIPMDDYISYHHDEVAFEPADDACHTWARHDMSKYEVKPTGRLLAGSKRVARARDNATAGAVAKGFQFGDGEKDEESVGQRGFVGLQRFELTARMEDSSMMPVSRVGTEKAS